jgi:FixJ family two-component response regulator
MVVYPQLKKNILVLDDNKNDLLMAKFVIMRMGYNPILLEKPSLLIDTLQLHKISLIVLDIDMPGLSGLDVLKKIKRVTSYKDIPIVMLTGHSDIAAVKTAINTGAVDYIVKPIDPAIFESKVKKLIGQQDEQSQSNWIEYEIKKSQDAEMRLYIGTQLQSIGEMSLTLKTKQPLPIGLTFYTEAPLFEELEIKQPPVKVESCEPLNDEFVVKCTLMGLSEADLKKIRLYNQLLTRKTAS